LPGDGPGLGVGVDGHVSLGYGELVRSNRLFSGTPCAHAATAPEIGLIVTAGACPLDDQGLGSRFSRISLSRSKRLP
jgi:hypothetical protein